VDEYLDPQSVVAAWTDPVRRASFEGSAPVSMPPNPAGEIELPELPADDESPARV
jgi:mersacidin/lichenicidin family type 2 lantibiotic